MVLKLDKVSLEAQKILLKTKKSYDNFYDNWLSSEALKLVKLDDTLSLKLAKEYILQFIASTEQLELYDEDIDSYFKLLHKHIHITRPYIVKL